MFTHLKEEIIISPRIGKWHELAEAIRLGCKLAPRQCFYDYDDGEGTACVVLAAWIAGWKRMIPEVECPVRKCDKLGKSLLPHLNDDHRWTREAIADWLDTL